MRRIPCIVVVALVAGTAAGDELWRQNPVDSFGGPSSQDARNTGGLGWFSETADNFDAQAGWNINAIEFWGGYDRVEPGATHGFMIRFYADNAGAIGALQSTQDVTAFTETVFYTFPPPLSFPGYHYTLTLNTPFVVPSAGRYWMSVVAILDRGGSATEPQWGWVAAQGISGPSCQQWFFAPGNFAPLGQDVSFVLNGTIGGPSPCYANCDHSTQAPVLNVLDFSCFLNKFASGDSYANCDGSTQTPVLNVLDFSCFLNRFAAGCT